MFNPFNVTTVVNPSIKVTPILHWLPPEHARPMGDWARYSYPPASQLGATTTLSHG